MSSISSSGSNSTTLAPSCRPQCEVSPYEKEARTAAEQGLAGRPTPKTLLLSSEEMVLVRTGAASSTRRFLCLMRILYFSTSGLGRFGLTRSHVLPRMEKKPPQNSSEEYAEGCESEDAGRPTGSYPPTVPSADGLRNTP